MNSDEAFEAALRALNTPWNFEGNQVMRAAARAIWDARGEFDAQTLASLEGPWPTPAVLDRCIEAIRGQK